METSKQKAIREAYFEEFRISGTKEEYIHERFDAIIYAIDSDGWLNGKLYKIDNSRFDVSISGSEIRPTSLFGIENNRGWITIESKEDLPKKTDTYHVIYADGTMIEHHFSVSSDFDRILFIEEFTHYQPIEKPKSPIY